MNFWTIKIRISFSWFIMVFVTKNLTQMQMESFNNSFFKKKHASSIILIRIQKLLNVHFSCSLISFTPSIPIVVIKHKTRCTQASPVTCVEWHIKEFCVCILRFILKYEPLSEIPSTVTATFIIWSLKKHLFYSWKRVC